MPLSSHPVDPVKTVFATRFGQDRSDERNRRFVTLIGDLANVIRWSVETQRLHASRILVLIRVVHLRSDALGARGRRAAGKGGSCSDQRVDKMVDLLLGMQSIDGHSQSRPGDKPNRRHPHAVRLD